MALSQSNALHHLTTMLPPIAAALVVEQPPPHIAGPPLPQLITRRPPPTTIRGSPLSSAHYTGPPLSHRHLPRHAAPLPATTVAPAHGWTVGAPPPSLPRRATAALSHTTPPSRPSLYVIVPPPGTPVAMPRHHPSKPPPRHVAASSVYLVCQAGKWVPYVSLVIMAGVIDELVERPSPITTEVLLRSPNKWLLDMFFFLSCRRCSNARQGTPGHHLNIQMKFT